MQGGSDPACEVTLELSPDLQSGRGIAWLLDELIDFHIHETYSFASERRLVVTLTQEVCVDDWCEERVLQEEHADSDASHDRQLNKRHGLHGRVVVGCVRE